MTRKVYPMHQACDAHTEASIYNKLGVRMRDPSHHIWGGGIMMWGCFGWSWFKKTRSVDHLDSLNGRHFPSYHLHPPDGTEPHTSSQCSTESGPEPLSEPLGYAGASFTTSPTLPSSLNQSCDISKCLIKWFRGDFICYQRKKKYCFFFTPTLH